MILQPGQLPGQEVAYVRGVPEQTGPVQRVMGELWLREGGSTAIVVAAAAVREASRHLVLARVKLPVGPLPDDLVHAARQAEQEFVRVAYRELNGPRQAPGSIPRSVS